MGRAQTIQIYLPSGDPAGLRVANLTTRTVRVFEVPRSLLAEFLKRAEAGQVGVYYLFGSRTTRRPGATSVSPETSGSGSSSTPALKISGPRPWWRCR